MLMLKDLELAMEAAQSFGAQASSTRSGSCASFYNRFAAQDGGLLNYGGLSDRNVPDEGIYVRLLDGPNRLRTKQR